MDEEFEDPRLAAVYDVLDPDRSDLEPYLARIESLGARRVLDLGCGTGVFALLLAARGIDVIGLDPAAASIAVARAKPGADAVRWCVGDVSALDASALDTSAIGVDALGVDDLDAVTMTANVAMVLLTDEAAAATIAAAASVLRPAGHLIFETRRPEARAWESWTPEATRRRADLSDGTWVQSWVEVTGLRWPLLDFCNHFAFSDGTCIASRSTLRYRDLDEWASLLDAAGFDVIEASGAPDRPGREWIVLARRR